MKKIQKVTGDLLPVKKKELIHFKNKKSSSATKGFSEYLTEESMELGLNPYDVLNFYKKEVKNYE